MARTIHGNLTGAAARTELRDQREWLRSAPDREAKKNRIYFGELQLQLIDLMGLEEFSRWYDNDQNIPPQLNWHAMEAIFTQMEAIIAELTPLKKTGRSSAQERPASSDQDQVTRQAPDPTDCITESEGK